MSNDVGQLRYYLIEFLGREIIHTQGADNRKCSNLNGNLPVETKNDIFVWKTDSSDYDCCMSNSRITLLFY